jgi:hypothetical protein
MMDPRGHHAPAPAESEKSRHPVVEELLSKQVSAMRLQGRSRADAEALVLRFLGGPNYLHLVDAFYPPGEQLEPPPAEVTSHRKGRRLSVLRSLMAKN